MLYGRKILLMVTGGIAAYKINLLVRQLVRSEAEVQVIISPAAENFVSKVTLSTLSKKPVYSDFYSSDGVWRNHVELALWADVVIIAPCTANTLGKMAHGLCDNLLMAIYMSAKCPVFVAPAMDLDMYLHPATQQNLEFLESIGNRIIPVEEGELASGLSGPGRMAEPESIYNTIESFFSTKNSVLAGKKILITAGPTYEAIDPVRFIGNHSSGKMGFAIAEEAAKRGMQVTLIAGPSSEIIKNQNIKVHRVISAREMFDEVFRYYDDADIAVASAAVADYAPKVVATEKIKKKEDHLTIELVKNPDILKSMGDKKSSQILVGFALETENEAANAREKLERKNLDLIVLNSLRDSGAGFKNDTNKITLISKDQNREFPLKSKKEVAADILDALEDIINNKSHATAL